MDVSSIKLDIFQESSRTLPIQASVSSSDKYITLLASYAEIRALVCCFHECDLAVYHSWKLFPCFRFDCYLYDKLDGSLYIYCEACFLSATSKSIECPDALPI